MIRLENLEVSINKSEIIKGVSFHVNKGDFVGLIGPNGSGKSTILKTIYKLIDKKCGAIYINGKEIDSISIKSMARELALVSQFNQYNFSFKVKDIVLMGRNPDEPTNHLDIKYQIEIMNIVKELNITVLAALHDMNLVSAYCNKVYMIDKGKVVYGGETKEVLTPKNIKDVFGVECEIGENSKGHITINFLF
ncbi:ABC transporter [Clostridium perfringens]|uniref:ABC transporter ATP-binding protein n=1 Tax=Clostridium perfringens TaxID=1502 RepID=UPI000D7101B2|nr:ABC transporter ATP-binding protein [Clostridium perfringens]PWX51773.1 ABC transporter [Clostridium perfringens]